MANNNQQIEEPVLGESALNAQKEFDVITDLLLVPLKADVVDQKLPYRRRWRGGCLLKRPDLVPFNRNNAEGFCNTKDGELQLWVKNQGTADASGFDTRVTFMPGTPGRYPPIDIRTDRKVEGNQVLRVGSVEIPEDCLESGECKFTITVDANNEVVEFDKSNNTVSGMCKGSDVD